MRKVCALAVCALALAGAATALASSSDYFGRASDGGDVQLRIKKLPPGQGGRKVTRFNFQRIGLRCPNGHGTTRGNLSFTRSITKGKFTIRGMNPKGGIIRVNGRVRDRAREVKGTIRLDGTIHLRGHRRFTKDCHSGLKTWTAKRL